MILQKHVTSVLHLQNTALTTIAKLQSCEDTWVPSGDEDCEMQLKVRQSYNMEPMLDYCV